MPRKPGSQRKSPKVIDRIIPGVGRISFRIENLPPDVVNDLNFRITEAKREGHMTALALLASRDLAPAEFVKNARRGTLGSVQGRLPLLPLLESWKRGLSLRGASIARYVQSWGILTELLPANATLSSLTTAWWDECVSSRRNGFGTRTPVSNSTLNRDLAAVMAFRKWASKRGYHLPAFEVEAMTEEPKVSGILTREQVALIEAVCRVDRWPFFWTLLETGARQGEVLNLTGSDIDKAGASIRIRPQDGSKGRKGRNVSCSPELHNYLLTLAQVAGGGRIFPFRRERVQEWWRVLAKEVGIEGVTLHGLRATFITRSLDDGIPSVRVARLVGHSSILMTERYYQNPSTTSEESERARRAVGIGSRFDAAPVPAMVPAPQHAAKAEIGS